MPDNIVDLQVGIGASLTQLESDLKDAENQISKLGDKPVKVAVTPEIDAEKFISQIQKAIAKQTVKVKVDPITTQKKAGKKDDVPIITPQVDVSDANEKLNNFMSQIKRLREISGAKDVTTKLNLDPGGDATSGILAYTNALGKAQTETYKLVDILDGEGELIAKEFQLVGETLSDNTTKAASFKEGLTSIKNTIDSFMLKNADIAEQIGMDSLLAKVKELENSTDAENTALQRLRNEFGAVKVKAEELRMTQKAQASEEKDTGQITSLQRQIELQDSIKAIRQGDTAEMERQLALLSEMERIAQRNLEAHSGEQTNHLEQLNYQRQINEIYKQREQIIAANAMRERQDASDKATKERQAGAERSAQERQIRAEQRAASQEQSSHEQTLGQLRSARSSSYRQEQLKIIDIYRRQNELIQKRIAIEKTASSSSNKRLIAALQYRQATLKTATHTARLAAYARDVANQINRAKTNMAGMQGYARSTMNIFKGIVLSQAFYKGLGAVKGVVGDAWELSKALNTAEAAFSGMLAGGQKQAQGLLEVLKQEAINTPFDLEELVKATRLLTAYGIKAENLMFVLRGIESAAAASGDSAKMERIALALGQIYTKGKLAGEEVRQLTESGVAVSEILAEELGLTQQELRQDWAKLGIEANTAINAIVRGIERKYGAALENMAQTTEQKLNNMKESFALIASSLTDPIRRGVDTIIDAITPKIERLYQAIQAVGLGDALRSLIPPAIFDGVVTAIDRIVGAVQAVKIAFQQMKPIIDAVLGALAWYGNIIYNVFITVAAVMGMIGNAVGSSATGVATLESAIKSLLGILLAYKAVMLAVAAVSKIWNIVATVMRGVILVGGLIIASVKGVAAAMGVAGMASATAWLPVVGVLLTIIGLAAALAGNLGSVIDAAKRVGTAFKNLGGGTTLGDKFKDMSDSMQTQIDAYNKKVTAQNAAMNNALLEDSATQTENSGAAAKATEKAMKGLMSFDEVYKLMEPSAGGGGGGGGAVAPIEGIEMPPIDAGGIFDAFGGIGDDLFRDMDLGFEELQDALGGLWDELRPVLDDVLFYVLKMLGYFVEMHLKAKLMSAESEEQWRLERLQTSEDTEQKKQEELQTAQDTEQKRQEELQTAQDTEQKRQEELQTSQDTEQKKQEELQTAQDMEQKKQEELQTAQDMEQKKQEELQTAQDMEQKKQEELQTAQDMEQKKQEELQTAQDMEQKKQEELQTSQDLEQLAHEKSQTAEDREQWTITRTGGGGGTGQAGTAAALALINVAQIGASVSAIIDNIKDLKDGSADLSEWVSLFVSGLMLAVDALQLLSAVKILTGGLGGVGGATLAGGAVKAGTAAMAGGVTAGGLAAGGLAAGAALAGIAGIVAVTKSLHEQGIVLDENKNKTEALVKATQDSSSAYTAKAIVVNGLNNMTKDQTKRLFELAGQTKRTAGEQAEMDSIIGKLNTAFPKMNLGIDTETGKLNLAESAVWKYVDAQKERDRLALLTERRNELLSQEAILQSELAAAVERLAAAEKARSEAPELTMDLQIAVENAREEVDLLTGALDANGKKLAFVDEKYQESATIVGDSQDDIIESIESRIAREAEEYKKAEELLAAEQDAYHNYYTSLEALTKSHHSRLNAISAAGYAEADIGMDDWLTGMTTRQEQEYRHQENIAKLAGRDIPEGMLEELKAAGPEYSKLIEELANANEDDLKEVVKVWEKNGDLARKKALEELGPMPKEARALLKRYQAATDEELEKLVDSYATQHGLSREEAVKELSGLSPESAAIVQEAVDYVKGTGTTDMRNAYSKMGEEGKSGLSSTERDAIRASGDIADAVVNEAIRRKDSMRDEYMRMGDEGRRGLAGKLQDLIKTAANIADATVAEAEKRKGSMRTRYTEMGEEGRKGLAGKLQDLIKTAANIADSAVAETDKRKNAMRTAGSSSTSSYIEGLKSNTTNVKNAVAGIADTVKQNIEKLNLRGSGTSIIDTLVNGIRGKSSSATSAFTTLMSNMLKPMSTFTEKVATALNTMLVNFANSVKSVKVSSSGAVSYSKMQGVSRITMAEGGQIKRAAQGLTLLRKSTMLAPNVEAGEAGAEIVFPLENTPFIKSFAKTIAESVGDYTVRQSAQHINAQMEQARANEARMTSVLSAPSASEISDAIRSWFTPQMQSLHDVLEGDRSVDINVPATSDALWRTILFELKRVNTGTGARGLSVIK